MNTPKKIGLVIVKGTNWRLALLIVIIIGSLLCILCLEPIMQDTNYHLFADTRNFFILQNVFNLVSNLPFLIIGAMGLQFCFNNKLGATHNTWVVLFLSVGLVGIGSAYYHWNPTNQTLLWDRLPMTVGFMGLFIALISEYISSKVTFGLLPAITLGLATVLYWHWFDDLRFYLWIQLVPLLTIPAVTILFRSGYSHQWLLLVAFSWYVLAKLAEFYDEQIFLVTQELISGHSLKHLLAAASCYSILIMLQRRQHN